MYSRGAGETCNIVGSNTEGRGRSGKGVREREVLHIENVVLPHTKKLRRETKSR